MRVLVACEFSGVVRRAFAARGWDAWSCDLLPAEDGSDRHIQGDCLAVLDCGWDMMIAHPPCTYLCAGGVNWINRKPEWRPNRDKAVEFVRQLMSAPIPRIAVENPIGHLSTAIRKPDQVFRVWQFGELYKKDVCLWLKNLSPLVPSHLIKPHGLKTFDFSSKSRLTPAGGSKKSVTFAAVANAMAEQWGRITEPEAA